MIFIEDRGSLFDAPIDIVWKYLFAGEEHDRVHKSTRNPSFKSLSKREFIYSSERNMSGHWIRESLRLSVFPPLGMATEMLEGPFAGSKMFYLYSPRRNKTQIDVFGAFSSKKIRPQDLEQTARKFLETEFNEDSPGIRAFAKNKKSTEGRLMFFKDVGSKFDAPIDVVWNYFFHGGKDHDQAHKNARNFKFKPISETVSVFSSERKRRGRWTQESVRMTNLAPLGYVFEMLKGPITGSRMFYVYIPKGNMTQINVYGYLKSRSIPRNKLKREVLGNLARDFKEDAPVLKAFAHKKH